MTDLVPAEVAADAVLALIRAGVVPNTRAALNRIEQVTTLAERDLAAAKVRMIAANWAVQLRLPDPPPEIVTVCPRPTREEMEWAGRPPELAPFQCPACGRRFHVRRHLDVHTAGAETVQLSPSQEETEA